MVSLAQYVRVLKLFWQVTIAAELEYRVNFVIAVISSIGGLAGSLFGLFLFYRTDYTFPGWLWSEALVVLGIFTILQGVAATFLVPNLNKIVSYVQEGTLDFVLLKPVSSQFWLSTHTVSLWGLPDLIFGLVIVFYAGRQVGLSALDYLAMLPPLGFGILSLYSLWFILGATSIWFVKIYNVTEVLRSLLEAGRFPIEGYPAAYRVFFTFIIPVAFLTTVPAKTMMGRSEPTWLLGSALLALILFQFSRWFWRFALRFYTSASS
ncbi:ABC-2 family transporter protein [cf. Phormidesmis sp. LEGE 11477]|nr:ABC-2 family transporter protein [cf. Phormidesmis sp. LEGE 11477]